MLGLPGRRVLNRPSTDAFLLTVAHTIPRPRTPAFWSAGVTSPAWPEQRVVQVRRQIGSASSSTTRNDVQAAARSKSAPLLWLYRFLVDQVRIPDSHFPPYNQWVSGIPAARRGLRLPHGDCVCVADAPFYDLPSNAMAVPTARCRAIGMVSPEHWNPGSEDRYSVPGTRPVEYTPPVRKRENDDRPAEPE